ncbi:MAG: hypothetical protein EU540_07875, partial [Promethearchaeota archaeon]
MSGNRNRIGREKILFLICLYFALLIASNIQISQDSIKQNLNEFEEFEGGKLKNSDYWILDNITIDNDGGTAGYITWSEAAALDWCSGEGSWDKPYVIENVTVNSQGSKCVEILDSSVPFIIRNCTFHNSGGYDVVKLVNVNNGTLSNNTLYDCTEDGLALEFSSNNTIIKNVIHDVDDAINMKNSDNNDILNNTLYNNVDYGIYAFQDAGDGCDNTTVSYNIISNNDGGIYFSYGYNNNITYNNITNGQRSSDEGIIVRYHGNHQIIGNFISNNLGTGIENYQSDFNNISHNILIKNGQKGIYIYRSENIAMRNNDMTNDGIELFVGSSGTEAELTSHIIETSNTINGRLVYYYTYQNNLQGSHFTNAGAVILAYCDDSVVSNQNLSNGTQAVSLLYCENVTVESNNITDNGYYGTYILEGMNNKIKDNSIIGNSMGIYCEYSPFNNYSNNQIINNTVVGIYFRYSSYNTSIVGNNIYNNGDNGIYAFNSVNNTIIGNNITDNGDHGAYIYNSGFQTIEGNLIQNNLDAGIYIRGSDNNTIRGNTLSDNRFYGFYIYQCEYQTLKNNDMENNGVWLVVSSNPLDLTSHTIEPSNTVNNKPVYYYKNTRDLGASNFVNAGQIILTYCNDSIINNLKLSNGTAGVALYYC